MRISVGLLVLAMGLTACSRPRSVGYQGYLEGEFVYVASPLAGRIDKLQVVKGAQVDAGSPLFTLEKTSELAGQRQAAELFRAAQARLEDLQQGARPSEIAALEARWEEARSAAELSRLELKRQERLRQTEAISEDEFDRARLAYDQRKHAVDELAAQVATARLGGRSSAIAAAESEARAAAAALERADWSVRQKSPTAPLAALVYDTLFREGEYAAAGVPVVSLLPSENIKVRFFVPEKEIGTIKVGDRLMVGLDGAAAREAQVSYVSPQPEYTPPILYNQENRSKLVFLAEARFREAGPAGQLHPGQPVDVTRAKQP
jgi:HlyD family secretion protein